MTHVYCIAGLELGNLTWAEFTTCPVPENSFKSLLELMGIQGGVRSLTFHKGRGSIQPFHLQNLQALSRLGKDIIAILGMVTCILAHAQEISINNTF